MLIFSILCFFSTEQRIQCQRTLCCFGTSYTHAINCTRFAGTICTRKPAYCMQMYIIILEYNHTEVQLQNNLTYKTSHTSSHAVFTKRTYRVKVACFGQEHIGNTIHYTYRRSLKIATGSILVPLSIFVSPIQHRYSSMLQLDDGMVIPANGHPSQQVKSPTYSNYVDRDQRASAIAKQPLTSTVCTQ